MRALFNSSYFVQSSTNTNQYERSCARLADVKVKDTLRAASI